MPELLQRGWDALVSTPGLAALLVGVWLLYLVWLGGWIVLQKREPVATLSWLLGLALLPYVGFLIYHVFGPQRIRRQRLRRAHSRARIPQDQDGFSAHADAAELAKLARAASGLAPASATAVRLLIDGGGTYEALLADIARARDHVHLEYYIYHPDRCGAALRDALVERARAGVKVRLLIDAIGGSRARHFFGALSAAGGEVAWFHPTRFGRFWQRPWLNLRTHRKIVVIDGRIGYTGGINISEDHDERRRDDAFRDLHVRIEGEAVRRLQKVFVEDWIYAGADDRCLDGIAAQTPEADRGPVAAQVLTSGPDSPWESIHRIYVSAIHAARERVWLVTPYFVPGEAAMMALTSAALAGLDVRLLLPKRSDSLLVTLAARSYFDALLDAGVKVYEYGPRMLHTKALVIDDSLALVGSANFDHRSFRLNFEVSVLFDDAALASELAAHVEGELRQAARVRPAGRRPLRQRLPEALARLLSPLL
ncbi:cardiolipin synthase [Luteimonas sp. RD2P54]|uniref:Cardiolipin synthase n=1 Tax=Luteimonas endophytica TaxID=3042023 RepID=A0ABT6J7A3_9GAMM|nr:cardiolipin synthase [Luteimonas endophytica]MDH5822619.1 cardiolipin synthase [Luteimonas endophytica]